MRLRLLLCAALVCFGFGTVSAAEPEKFELKDGDRAVFLGNTLIEREQKYGYWELMLTMAWPERNVTFRNLGWSGDTVWGESRAGFGSQADGFKKLVEEVNAARPTVIFVGYGNVEAFDGEKGLPKFVDGFGKLLDELEKTKARIVILGPTHVARRGGTYFAYGPKQNTNIDLYLKSMREIAAMRNHRFVDFKGLVTTEGKYRDDPRYEESLGGAITTNGQDLTAAGYSFYSDRLLRELETVSWASDLVNEESHKAEFIAKKLVAAIHKKNELFFHRWRPQNETYLFGFRKHEQGKNAVEVFQFDPLVEAEEKTIAKLRVELAAELKSIAGKKE